MTDHEKLIFKRGVIDGLGQAREIVDAHLGSEHLATLELHQFADHLMSISRMIGDRIAEEVGMRKPKK